MKAKAKTIKLLLSDGTMDGVIYIEDSLWNGGKLYSSPREMVNDLLMMEDCENYGIYLLVSSSKVYVGQSTSLKQRINQHIIGKDWWEKVILITTNGDLLNKSDIDFLESVLIAKANDCGTLDIDNKNKGNPAKVEMFRRVELIQFLDEALSLLELIGINVFFRARKKTIPKLDTPIKDKSDEQKGIRSKKETLLFLKGKGLSIGVNVSYAKLLENKRLFWLNPLVDFTKKEWFVLLNNQMEKTITVLQIPPNSFSYNYPLKKGILVTRKDRPYYLDLNIEPKNYVDQRSGCEFSKFIIAQINY